MQSYNGLFFNRDDSIEVLVEKDGKVTIFITDPREHTLRLKLTAAKETWRYFIRTFFKQLYEPEEGIENPLTL